MARRASTPPPPGAVAASAGGSSSSRPPSRSNSPVPSGGGSGGDISQSDPKLFHLVKRIVSQNPSLLNSNSGSGNNSSGINSAGGGGKKVLDVLTGAHREYRRKNASILLGQVNSCLAIIKSQGGVKKRDPPARVAIGGGSGAAAAAAASTAASNQASATNKADTAASSQGGVSSAESISAGEKKRKREEEAYEASAQRYDQVQNPGGSTMLNAGLRSRYSELQRGRDAEDRAAAAAAQKKKDKEEAAAAAAAAAAGADENNAGGDEGGKMEADASADERPNTPTSLLPASRAVGTDGNGGGTGAAAVAGGSPGAAAVKKRRKKVSGARSTPSRSGSTVGSGLPGSDGFGPDGSGADRNLIAPTPTPSTRYNQLGGIDKIITQIRQIIEYPLTHPEIFRHLGVDPPRGVLLRGPPGCGKSVLADAIAGELGVTYYKVSAPEIVTGISGESERQIRGLFRAAAENAPAIIFIDEIDVIAPKRGDGGGGGKGMEKRMVAQMLTCLDDLNPKQTRGGNPVMVIAATNRPDSIDSALRRAGRFDREISLSVPDEEARIGILKCMTGAMRLEGNFDYKDLARKTPGYVGADIRSLCKEAAVVAVNRIFRTLLPDSDSGESTAAASDAIGSMDISPSTANTDSDEKKSDGDGAEQKAAEDAKTASSIATLDPLTPEQLQPLYLTMADFLDAIQHVQPSSKREGFATVPDVSWDNIGALQTIREELTLSVLEPISHPEKFKQLGLPLPAGVLLYGPPGCGKTLLAKAIANESGANFMSVKGPELLDKYVGESERAVRVLFDRARSSSPCIVFFDELDSLCPKRGSDSGSGGGGVSERVVNQLLTEMDGLDERRSIFVIAATNRPELIDPAMMRPGRLDKLLYVPLPTPDDRVAILHAVASKVELASDVDLDKIGRSPRAEGYSGADCTALLREAGLAVLRDDTLTRRGFRKAPTGETANVTPTGEKAETEAGHEEEIPRLQIQSKHFDYAFDHVLPSVSKKDQARYDRMRDRMARARSRGGGVTGEADVDGGADNKSDEKPKADGSDEKAQPSTK